jgi:chromosome segregation ATPase
MGLIDEYRGSQGDEDGGGIDPSGPVATRKSRADLERQIIMVNSDLGKLLREKDDLELEQRKLRKEEERIRIERDALDEKLKKMENDQRLLEEELKGLKKKLKILPT